MQQLIRNAGADYAGATDALKVHIRRLRETVEVDPSRPQLILTKTGIGLSLRGFP